jgi:hypothetical protein
MLTRRSLLLTPLAASLARSVDPQPVAARRAVPRVSQATAWMEDLARFVNPFLGTARHGHTFPGATVAFVLLLFALAGRLERRLPAWRYQ